MMKKLFLIVNPTSGKMRTKNELMGICKIFCDAEYAVRVHVTRCKGDAERVAEENAKDFDVIVACGGDGTFNEVASGTLRAGFRGELGFIPCGTTNDLASSLGISKSLSKAALQITYEKSGAIDFGSFNGSSYFGYVASFGAFTDVSYSTDQKMKNVFGHAAYVTEALTRLVDLRPYRMRVICDGEEHEDDFLFGAAANSFSIGGVLKLKKDRVDVGDGMHEVLLIRKPKTASDLAQLPVELLSGNYENKSVLFFRGKEITFCAEEAIPWCVDGEYAGEHEKVEIRNLHHAIRVIYPHSALVLPMKKK